MAREAKHVQPPAHPAGPAVTAVPRVPPPPKVGPVVASPLSTVSDFAAPPAVTAVRPEPVLPRPGGMVVPANHPTGAPLQPTQQTADGPAATVDEAPDDAVPAPMTRMDTAALVAAVAQDLIQTDPPSSTSPGRPPQDATPSAGSSVAGSSSPQLWFSATTVSRALAGLAIAVTTGLAAWILWPSSDIQPTLGVRSEKPAVTVVNDTVLPSTVPVPNQTGPSTALAEESAHAEDAMVAVPTTAVVPTDAADETPSAHPSPDASARDSTQTPVVAQTRPRAMTKSHRRKSRRSHRAPRTAAATPTPAPDPRTLTPPAKPAPKPAPTTGLAAAQEAYRRGQYATALTRAQAAYASTHAAAAAELAVRAACKLQRTATAKTYFDQVPRSRRKPLRTMCRDRGVRLGI